MANRDENLFVEPLLRFSLRKPDAWRFMPPAWSPVARMKNASDASAEWLRRANEPFCCAMGHHESRAHPYPTLQVTVRPFQIPSNEIAERFLQTQLDFLKEQYEGFSLIHATADGLVAGYRATVIRATFILYVQQADDVIPMSVLARTYVLFTPGRAFTVGLSSSADEQYFDEAEFERIISSVRIGA